MLLFYSIAYVFVATHAADKITCLADNEDDYVASLVDLDIDSLKTVLSVKCDQEEVSDFSFSFNQSDLCLAVVQWITFDRPRRFDFLAELAPFFCIHQISSFAASSLANLLAGSPLAEEYRVTELRARSNTFVITIVILTTVVCVRRLGRVS